MPPCPRRTEGGCRYPRCRGGAGERSSSGRPPSRSPLSGQAMSPCPSLVGFDGREVPDRPLLPFPAREGRCRRSPPAAPKVDARSRVHAFVRTSPAARAGASLGMAFLRDDADATGSARTPERVSEWRPGGVPASRPEGFLDALQERNGGELVKDCLRTEFRRLPGDLLPGSGRPRCPPATARSCGPSADRCHSASSCRGAGAGVSLPGMVDVGVRRVMACGGGLLAGGVLGAELLAPDGSVKGMLAGLGVGLLVAALVRA